MNRPLRHLAAVPVVLSLALAMPAAAQSQESPFPASGWYGVVSPASSPAAVHAQESPFPASGWYGVVSPASSTSNYSGRFGTYGSGYGGSYNSYNTSYSTPAHTAGQVAGGTAYVAMRLFPPLMLVALPVVAVVLVAKGIDSAVSSAKSGE